MKTVLITCPQLEREGGVASFYAAVRTRLPSTVWLLQYGLRSDRQSLAFKIWAALGDQLILLKAIRQRRCDCVIVNPSLEPRALIRDGITVAISHARGVRTAVFFHGWNLHFEKRIGRWWRLFLRLTLFRSHKAAFLCDSFRDVFRQWGYRGVTIPAATVVDDGILHFGSNAHQRRVGAKESGSPRPFNILFLARIERAKGVYIALDAFKILRASIPGVVLTVAGSGTELERLATLVNEQQLHNVRILGFVRGEQKNAAFSDADCYILPTFDGEGMPISVLEAMAFGLPVISRPVAAIPSIVEDSVTGCLIDSLAPEAFAERIQMLIQHPGLRLRMGAAGQERVRERFTAEKAIALLVKLSS